MKHDYTKTTKDFCHILLTRFNVPSENNRYQKAIQSENWLDNRFKLFENYCLPSIKNQTEQNFTWFIYFDANTPNKYKKKVNGYSKSFPNLIPIWVSSLSIDLIKQDIEKKSKGYNYLLTTRLDNDDALDPHFFKFLHQQISQTTTYPIALNFPNGIIYNEKKTYKHSDYSNAFISLFEPKQNFKTIWCEQHQKIIKKYNSIQINDNFMWLQVVHQKNISNRIKGIRVSISALDRFGIFEKKKKPSLEKISIFCENTLLTPIRLLKEYVIQKIKYVIKT